MRKWIKKDNRHYLSLPYWLFIGGWIAGVILLLLLEYLNLRVKLNIQKGYWYSIFIIWGIPVSFATFIGISNIVRKKLANCSFIKIKSITIIFWLILMGVQTMIFIYGVIFIDLSIRKM